MTTVTNTITREYPSRRQVERTEEAETEAVNLCATAMIEAAKGAPLTKGLQVYAAMEAAIALCGLDYATEVFNEISLVDAIGKRRGVIQLEDISPN